MTEEEAVGCVKMWIRKKVSLKLVKTLCFIGKKVYFYFLKQKLPCGKQCGKGVDKTGILPHRCG